jgi:hypothetical protein
MAEEIVSTIEPGVADAALFDAMFNKKEPAKDEKSRADNGQFKSQENKESGSSEQANPAESDGSEELDASAETNDSDPGVDDLEDEADVQPDNEDVEFEIKVEGKVVKATLKQLKDNYSGEKAIEKRIQDATKLRNAAEQEAIQLSNFNRATVEKLKQIDTILGQFAQPNIDWEKLKTADPLQYAIKREEARDMQDKQRAVQEEIRRVNEQQEQLSSQASQRYLKDQAEALVAKLPDFGDPDKAQSLMSRYQSAAEDYGYSKQELGTVTDHRALLVLHDATKYRELVARKQAMTNKATPAVATKTMRIVASKPASITSKSRDDANWKRARETGKPDDVAKLLMVPKKKA